MARRTDPATDWQKNEWELRPNLPERVTLCEAASDRASLLYDYCWHTADCGHYRRAHPDVQRRKGWDYDLPLALLVQTFESATATSPVGFCQHCTIKRVA